MTGWVLLLVVLNAVDGFHEDVLPLSAPVNASIVTAEDSCFDVEPELCPSITEICRCKRIDNESAVCCHISALFYLKEGMGCITGGPSIRKLHIQNATFSHLTELDMSPISGLTSLAITNSHLKTVRGAPRWSDLQCLNLSDNVVDNLNPDAFVRLHKLQYFAMANVNISRLPRFKVKNATVNFAGRKAGVECSIFKKYLKENPNLKFVNQNSTFCFVNSLSNKWFNSTDYLCLTQLQAVHHNEESCVKNCTCFVEKLDIVAFSLPKLKMHVNCSFRGFKSLPEELPPNTISLNVSNNEITYCNREGEGSTDASKGVPQNAKKQQNSSKFKVAINFNKQIVSLDAFQKEDYKNIRAFYADSNQITSILALEGTEFIDDFTVLSLKNNNIKSLPTYILSNTFDRNYQRVLLLGQNKLSCNCSVAQILKIWLYGNRIYIPDYNDIKCDNMNVKVIDLDMNKVCVYERDWTDYIYYIIAGEVALFLLLISKVSYDYWVFKTAGYLPWPASKMPKLPCDWVFE